ncbi:MAG TPA: hypothetical protein VEH07_03920 [Alphaproteobacteria bacterium]|nr:hypothetical protein [Alphaproteobacteria bacterium]
MDKYEPLGQFLGRQKVSRVPMTFEQVEKIIGAKLPRSAYKHRPWWANDATGHAHAKAWLEAGFHTEQVDMEARKFVFKRVSDSGAASPRPAEGGAHPLIGALKGLLWIHPAHDLTQPALDPKEWEEVLAEKYSGTRNR